MPPVTVTVYVPSGFVVAVPVPDPPWHTTSTLPPEIARPSAAVPLTTAELSGVGPLLEPLPQALNNAVTMASAPITRGVTGDLRFAGG